MIPTPHPAPETASARLLEDHRAAQRVELVEQMLAKFRAENPGATVAEVAAFVADLRRQIDRLPELPGGAR